ncbi:tyrosine-type recombinase/integrase [Pseudomonas sp. GX19020]|uniref:tyrosine-type recombinase/integrase n=1 Tax=Pseudomonas sp. GX19020 TaxID=2942277 RepID=UPI002018FDEA|nr:tyrosine-type recombinase/integrase [Pseudomonas sp. GX19020]MCL4068756.1 tyrosine-type recombinase/integrase [Pseudomonas sp. GX19020]
MATTDKIGVTICAWGRGKPTSYRGAADLITAVRREIGAEAFDIHGLRYSAAAELAAVGCSDELIAAVTGHATGAMVRKYAGAARQKVRAIGAQKLRK